ncbi:hypothetical protein PSCICF_20940 [Pseudomonas cichorii]|nr:hypothetical protein [Pseudomonas cichorii]MBX8606430.1 hypothetical protein [Pseudomonas cichorii]GFM55916.1 hypothetical protein PSCICF_20940 [Pseudomonas cichorii]GFM60159.1 hypothetical protein PSCICG_13190 [Pseudomonas cichorii]
MDYAIDPVTNKPVTADIALRTGYYICSYCRKRVGLRSGPSRKNYFAHWRGVSSGSCAYFMSGPLSHVNHDKVQPPPTRQMELRLLIKKGQNAGAWWIELVLPRCRACHAFVKLDVGGRVQKLDMRGMGSGFRVMAEPTANDYRIMSFEGKPDPSFVTGVAQTCPGLPARGAAAFTAIGRGSESGFPRAQAMNRCETYALLWSAPETPEFPEELLVDRLKPRQGWNLALVTVPEAPSDTCISWLEAFTQLSVMPAAPAITTIWPFLSRNVSINTVEYIEADAVILAAHRMPGGSHDGGPTLQAVNQHDRIAATAPDRSPALFTLIRAGSDEFKIGKSSHPDVDKFYSRSTSLGRSFQHPTVDLVFIDERGERLVASLHRRQTQSYVMDTRARKLHFDCLTMPRGAKGRLEVVSPSGQKEYRRLASIEESANYALQACQLPPAMNSLLKQYLTDPQYQLYLDFGGLGRLAISATQPLANPTPVLLSLGRSLRMRLQSFLSQLHVGGVTALSGSDQALVNAFGASMPRPELFPHYRQLVAAVCACGFDIRYSGDGISR